MMFYIMIESNSNYACFICDDDGLPQFFDSEDAAVVKANTVGKL